MGIAKYIVINVSLCFTETHRNVHDNLKTLKMLIFIYR